MLVLARKKNEGLVVGNDIRVVVFEIRSDKVTLGIEAPKDVAIHRDEVLAAIKAKSAEAAVDGEAADS